MNSTRFLYQINIVAILKNNMKKQENKTGGRQLRNCGFVWLIVAADMSEGGFG